MRPLLYRLIIFEYGGVEHDWGCEDDAKVKGRQAGQEAVQQAMMDALQ